MRGIRQHLSYANVAATLALVFAMSGGAIAATGGFVSASSPIRACVGANGVLKVLSGKRCKGGQKAVSWNQQGPAGPRGATGAAGLSGPSGTVGLNGAPGSSATNALTADNALALGGIPASGYTRSDCGSTTGQIKGFALVAQEPPLGGFTPVNPSYNCSGQPVEVERPEGADNGRYIVRFQGNPAEIAMATPILSGVQFPGAVSVSEEKPGEFDVFTSSFTSVEEDVAFELLLP